MLLFQHLGLLIDIKKSVLVGMSTVNLTMDFVTMILSLPKEKMAKTESVPRIIRKFEVTVRKLAKLIGRLSVSAVVPAPLQYHVIQRKQIQKLIQHNSFQRELKLSLKAKEELVL